MTAHPNLLSAENSLLLVIDIQTKLTNAMPESATQTLFRNSGILLTAAKTLNIPVVLTEQNPKGLGPTEPALTHLLPEEATIFPKTGFSCFSADGFEQVLDQIQRQQVIVIGQESHICVLQSALELLHRGFQVFVVDDAVCSRNPQHTTGALQRMQALGVTVINHESVLFEWLRDYTHPEFKNLSKLLIS